MTIHQPSKPSGTTYSGTVVGFVVYAVVCGYIAATASGNGWQSPFSWHPFLMTTGMISTMGIGAMTKKLGGYSNVKVRYVSIVELFLYF